MSAITTPEIKFPKNRTAWFSGARFGMFIHWGLYALLGRGEWVMSRERIPVDEYEKLLPDFKAEDFRPKEWAALAVEAGMKYAVLTTKHHEGFCLWDSKTCAFNAVKSGAGRDLVAEYVDAFRSAGLKVGLYYSLGDWRHPGYASGWRGDLTGRETFMDYTHGLIRELMTGYGKIDILWYDLPQCYTAEEWRAVELNAMVRSLQPHILINNRAFTAEDFGTPEQHVTATKPGRMWEACLTLNKHWGFCHSDNDYKNPRDVVLSLAAAAAGGGNLLLNVGPEPSGRIPEVSVRILKAVGEWVKQHEESIFGSERHALPWNHIGPVTVSGNKLYLFLENYFGPSFVLGGLTNKVVSATLLSTGASLKVEQKGPRTFVSGLPEASPDPVIPVVRFDLDGPPDQDLSRVIGGADIFPELP